MTTNEAINQLIEKDPNRSYYATKDVWYRSSDKSQRETYRLSIFPGLSGHDCDSTAGDSLEEALGIALFKWFNLPRLTINPNEE